MRKLGINDLQIKHCLMAASQDENVNGHCFGIRKWI